MTKAHRTWQRRRLRNFEPQPIATVMRGSHRLTVRPRRLGSRRSRAPHVMYDATTPTRGRVLMNRALSVLMIGVLVLPCVAKAQDAAAAQPITWGIMAGAENVTGGIRSEEPT